MLVRAVWSLATGDQHEMAALIAGFHGKVEPVDLQTHLHVALVDTSIPAKDPRLEIQCRWRVPGAFQVRGRIDIIFTNEGMDKLSACLVLFGHTIVSAHHICDRRGP